MESVQKQLEELGLSPNEVKVYLASLELGAATAQQIAGKAAVPRPTTYVAIGGLVKRGLVSSHTRGKKQYFQAERPEVLMRIINEEKSRIFERESKLKQLLPGLESLIVMAKEKPDVKYYEGIDGLESMRDVLLGVQADEIISIVNHNAHRRVVPEASNVLYGHKLKKTKMNGRQIILHNKKEKLADFVTSASNYKRKLYLTKEKAGFGEISVFGNYIALIAYLDKPFGFLMKSPDIADIARMLFDLAWESKKIRPFQGSI
jgi:sugar-specific transcriptional regulator TrmB